MRRLISFAAVPALAVMSLAAVPSAAPEVQATVVMKSGERHSGSNPRHRPDKGEFALRKSLAEEFRVPGDTVAYIDFGGTPDVDPQISGSQYAAVLRNGTVYRGQLIEMGHTNPSDTSSEYLVIFRDDKGQEHRWQSGQVGRVYFSGGATGTTGSGSGSGTTGATAGGSSGLVVSAKQQWTPTGITVRRGEILTFNSTGQIQLSGDSNDVATPAGARTPRQAANSPMPRELAGALIARIGNGQPFGVGNQTSITMPAAGVLFLGINDDELNDNSGEFRVDISRRPTRR